MNELDASTFFPETQKPQNLDKIKLDLNDYIKYTYVICRRLETEEQFRLETEE